MLPARYEPSGPFRVGAVDLQFADEEGSLHPDHVSGSSCEALNSAATAVGDG